MSDNGSGWEPVAAAWERHRTRAFEFSRRSSEWLLAEARIGKEDTVLELACGPGETGLLAAELVGPAGRVISTDLSPTMVEAARRGARARGLRNVETMVMDAQSLDLDDDVADAVICRLGMMFVPDPSEAFAEVRRVLRPGGRFAYTTLGSLDRNLYAGLLIQALREHGYQPVGTDPFAPGGALSLSSPERNVELLTAADFRDARSDLLDEAARFSDVDDYWEVRTALAGTDQVRAFVEELGPEQVRAVRSTLAELLEPFEVDGGIELPMGAVVSAATA